MKFDFDTYEFMALVAPGGVLVIALALFEPTLLHSSEPAVLIAAGLVGAYALGHLIAAIGNLAEPLFDALGARRLTSMELDEWVGRYLSETQLPRVQTFLDSVGNTKFAVKQMRLRIECKEHLERLETFNGLYNLSRGFAVAFTVAFGLGVAAHQFGAAFFSVVAIVLAVYRVRKFNVSYSVELVQQFLAADAAQINQQQQHERELAFAGVNDDL